MSTDTRFLPRPEGRIAYDVTGDGPLVVLVPGMGDLRSTYRFLAPALAAAGHRVVTTDLRGHGDSDATFTSYGDVETAGDLVALLDELGGPAVVVGNSLVGPFVRDGAINGVMKLVFRIATLTPFAAMTWKSYAPRLYAGAKPADLDAYLAEVIASIRRPGYAKAFSLTTRLTHAPAEARIADVTAPVLVVMGELDPDFPDPRAEADWIATTLHAEVVMVPESGHYPQSQRPEIVADAVLGFLTRVAHRA